MQQLAHQQLVDGGCGQLSACFEYCHIAVLLAVTVSLACAPQVVVRTGSNGGTEAAGSTAGSISLLPGPGINLARQTLGLRATLNPATLSCQNPGSLSRTYDGGSHSSSSSNHCPAGAVSIDLPAIALQLVGQHQQQNVQTAVAAALLLQQRGWVGITAAAIQDGLEAAWLPGRFQVTP
jgi:hypothetical protein